jgi:surfactin synthase thioesterase subunit
LTRGEAASMIVPVRPNGSRPPLVVLSAGYGDVFALGRLARQLDPDQPLYVLQPPERDPRRPSSVRIADRVALYVEALGSVQPRGPHYLAGNSSGGLVALSLARTLLDRGETVGLLALLDTPTALSAANMLVHGIAQATLPRLPLPVGMMPTRMRALREMAIDRGFASTVESLRGYRPAPIAVPIAYFRARHQHSLESLAYGGLGVSLDQWRALASAGMTVDEIPGVHPEMIRRYAPILIERLTARLADARRIVTSPAGR